ncbi:MAG: trypsin-like peptidase domain-containing protein, partial [Clostridiaceae bacterium]|nr:trypsin-like peptidase domain-containing protein [Clostridiaceae bacterium]
WNSTQQNTGSQSGNAWNSTQQNTGSQSGNAWNSTQQNTGSQSGGTWNSTQGYAGNSWGSQSTGGGNGSYQNAGSGQNGKGKRGMRRKGGFMDTWGKKLLVSAVCAIVFGVVGAFAFQTAAGMLDKSGADEQQVSDSNGDGTDVSVASGTTGSAVGTSDVATIAEQCMPAVVAITSTTEGTDYYDLFGQYYQGEDTASSGTGFIVGKNDDELLIATNNHVIDGAKTISVQFIDDEIYEAEEKGSDSANDLAVVAVDVSKVKDSTMEQIKIADLGDSDEVKVGEKVVAIGNALGYGQSVTVGYISAKDREITESSSDGSTQNTITAIQTDAAINPGNSGGALINMQGQVIGINSAKIADSSVEGVGYAIPISVATPIIDELMNREILKDSEKGYLGISGSTVTQGASAYNLPYGVYVKEVAEGGAADKGGIKVNDIITAVDKMEVTTMESLQEKINSYRKGTEVEITVQRSTDGVYKAKKLTVTLQGSESLDGLSGSTDNNSDSSDSDQGNDSDSGQNRDGNQDGSGGDQYNGNNDRGGSGSGGSSDGGSSDGGSDSNDFWGNFFN